MIDFTPPQAIEAEQSLLACSLFTGRDTQIEDECFYRDAHRIINKTLRSMASENKPIDLVSVCDSLSNSGQLETVGGATYIAHLYEIGIDSPNIDVYRNIITSKSNLRRLAHFCQQTLTEISAGNGFKPDKYCLDWLSRAQNVVAINNKNEEPLNKTVGRVIADIEKRAAEKSDVIGVPCGFKDVDMLTRGFKPSNLYIIAGRPSMGKTAFGLCSARNSAKLTKTKALFFSLEMAREDLVVRLLGIESNVDTEKIQTGMMAKDEYLRVIHAAKKIGELPIIIDDNPLVSEVEIQHITRKHKPGIVFIDHLSLVRSAERQENETLRIGTITKSGKALAKQLGIPVVFLCQLNRKVEERADKRPMLSDLRQSGEIEQDADAVLLLYRDEYYNQATSAKGTAEINLAKHRNGRTGTVKLAWVEHYARFEPLAVGF